jgi:thioesterase DpgC
LNIQTEQIFSEAALLRWANTNVLFTGDAGADWDALAVHLAAGEHLFARLPPKPERDSALQRMANVLQHTSRQLRQRFMQTYADWVYDVLSEGRTRRLAIAALSEAASVRFPGLVPTPAQLVAEREQLQGDKEGREIDQGIFFAAILAAPHGGPHFAATMLRPTPRALVMLERFQSQGSLRLDTLLIERVDGVARLTVHNEACLNAEDATLIADMETAVDLVLLDDATGVFVLRGCVMTHPKYAGRRVFSAGINLKQLHQGRISLAGFLLQRELGYISKMLHGLHVDRETSLAGPEVVSKPWIAAVDSFAIGGGAQLLLVADHVIAEAGSYFCLPAAQEGIVPGVANLRLTRAVGSRMARQIILSGRKVSTQDRDSHLVFDEVVEAADMDRAVADCAARLNNPAVRANRRMLALAEEPMHDFLNYMSAFAYEQALRLYSEDVLNKVRNA